MCAFGAMAAEVAFETEQMPDGCRLLRGNLPSASMGRDIRIVVVLPPGYEDEGSATYPFLYSLHGANAPYDTWSQMSPLREALKRCPMVMVCFDGDKASWYLDSPVKKDSQFTTFFFDELMPWVEKRFRCGGVRGVNGFSMGGFGALHFMLTKPDAFASVSALSAPFYRSGELPARITDYLKDLLAEPGAGTFDEGIVDFFARFEQRLKDPVTVPPLLLHSGTEDGFLPTQRAFCEFLAGHNQAIRKRLDPQVSDVADPAEKRKALGRLVEKAQIDFRCVESPGGHDWAFWKRVSDEVVDFHWKAFQRAAASPAGKGGGPNAQAQSGAF
jgi:S-formylglutathione hydrolase FrmB